MDSSTQNIGPSDSALAFMISEVKHYKNNLLLRFRVFTKLDIAYDTQPSFIINKLVAFQMALKRDPVHPQLVSQFYVKFSKVKVNYKPSTIKFNYMHMKNNILEKYFTTDGKWHQIATYDCRKLDEMKSRFVVAAELFDAPSLNPVPDSKQDTLDKTCPNCSKHVDDTPSASPQDDTVMPDVTYIELLGKDGSVHLLKVIAATSPFPFSGNRQGTAKCVVNIPGTTRVTLQHLKESIIYSNTLPGTDFEELLILASYNTMSELELRCVDALSMSITPNIAYNLTEFAGKYNIQELLYKLKKNVQDDILKLDQISEYVASNLRLFEIK